VTRGSVRGIREPYGQTVRTDAGLSNFADPKRSCGPHGMRRARGYRGSNALDK